MSISTRELAGRILKQHIVTVFRIGVACATVAKSFYTVHDGQCAVVLDRFRGILDKTAEEGTHLLIPWIQRPLFLNVRARPSDISSVSGTKDLQTVNLTLRIISRPEVYLLREIFETLGTDYDKKVLPSIGNEVLKVVVSQFNADELLTDRARFTALMRESLIQRAQDFNICLEDVAITHLSYGEEFSKAVEKKQVAQLEAERSKLVVLKTEQESKAAIVKAEGESACAKLICDATEDAGMGLIELRMIEAAEENAAVLCRNGTVMYFPSSNNMVVDVNPGPQS